MMNFYLSWFDRTENKTKETFFEAKSIKEAIKKAKKHFEKLETGTWNDPELNQLFEIEEERE